ncbi:MAG: hypothetical protein CMD68_02525 [Gammaproteobacteria bacterium]|nr:hypothetical protein [Gammaproteobacteria bacterium]
MKLNIQIITRLVLITIATLIAIFYFFAKGVVIEISPGSAAENAKINLERGLGFKAGNRFIFFPGKKTLQIESPGFYSESHEIYIDSSSDTKVIELSKKPGKVFFNINSDLNFRIFIDGEESTKTTDFYLIEAGNRLIEIRNPLYLPFSKEISVIGMDKQQTFDLKLVANSGELYVTSNPKEADIYIGKTFRGKTPLKVELPSGLNKLILKKEGYTDFTILEKIEVGKTKSISPVQLSLLPGKVRLDSAPKNSKVMVDDIFKGFTPLEIFLEPDFDHIISISAEGYLPSLKNINVKSNSDSSVFFKLDEEYGNVSIDSNIVAGIFIGDKFIGETPFNGQLQSVNQKISIKQKNFRTYSTVIKPSSAFDTKISALLIKEEIARFNESPPEYTTKANQVMKLFKPEMIVMGAKRSEIGQRANETIRKVKLTKPFYLSIHEVTNLQFSFFKKNHLLKAGIIESHPITNISWNEAAIYCNWLSSNEGLNNFYIVKDGNVIGMNYKSNGYRLPTESEWSWVARAQDKKNVYLKYPWGSSMPIPKSFGNFADESAKTILTLYIPNYTDTFVKTAPVGSFSPNKKGIFDLGGNVSEYVNDFYSIQPNSEEIIIDFLGPSKRGSSHVIKGSNWKSASNTQLRYAYRDKLSEGNDVTGFRVARWLIGIDNEE